MSDYIKRTIEEDYYLEQELTINNSPDLGDNGEHFLKDLKHAIDDSNKYINDGYRIMSFTAGGPDLGVKMTLRKNKEQ